MAKSEKRCVVGYYFSVDEIMEACRKVRDRGFKKFDSFTPFPIHGIEEAMGMKRSTLPYLSFLCGLMGFGLGAFLTIWTHYFSWPINVGGKPLFALPAYIPVMFETTVLVAGVGTIVIMFALYLGLPNFSKPIFHPDITSHRFAIAIEVENEDEVEPVKNFLTEIQAQEVHDVEAAL